MQLHLQVYTEFRLSQFPSLTPLITEYAQGTNKLTSLGPYFQRPGRTILERYLVDVPEPSDVLGDDALLELKRVYFCGVFPFTCISYPLMHYARR